MSLKYLKIIIDYCNKARSDFRDSPGLLLIFLGLSKVSPPFVLVVNRISQLPGVPSVQETYTLLPYALIDG